MKRIIIVYHISLLLLLFMFSSKSYSGNIPVGFCEAYIGDFIVSKQANGFLIVKWTTISEHDNDFFSIEYSSDGQNYRSIGKVSSLGNTANGFSYQFVHDKPQRGKNYYQLKMVEISGKVKVSDIRMVMVNGDDHLLIIFPNPAIGAAYLQLDVKDGEKLNAAILDMSGRLVRQSTCTIKDQQGELRLDGLQQGMYVIVAVTSTGQQFKSRLIVLVR